ncbi:ABC-three component system middle component 6 [Deferribacteres bacterium DY0037]
MPTKHIKFSESLLGLGSYILTLLTSPKSVDELWDELCIDIENGVYHTKHSFDSFIMALLVLYSIEQINENDGVLLKCI